MLDANFVDGIFIKDIPDTAPDYILGNYSINIPKFKKWLDDNEQHAVKGWLNITVKKSSKGNKYAVLDTYMSEKNKEAYEKFKQVGRNLRQQEELPTIQQGEDIDVSDIPF